MVSNLLHLVTQWMSNVGVIDGIATSSSKPIVNGVVDEPVDRQIPLPRLVVGDVADVQHREAVGRVLPRRQPRRVDALLDEVLTVAIEEAHSNQSARPALPLRR